MEASETSLVKPGLRERKKQRTRETIERVALELFAERGYEHTTLAEIAEAADVSTRTIFSYFDSKEDILFCGEPVFYAELKQKLEHRPAGANTVDALREFLFTLTPPTEHMLLRKKIIGSDEGLRRTERARFGRVEELIAQSIAKDLEAEPGDIRPTLVAASVSAAFMAVRDRLEAQSGGEPMPFDQVIPVVDEVLEFLRGGLEVLQRS